MEQGLRRFKLRETFKKTEKTGPFLLEFVIVEIDDRCDPSDDITVLFGEEISRLCMMEKGVFLSQDELHFAQERRNPMGISLVDPPGKADELIQPFLVRNELYFHRQPGFWILDCRCMLSDPELPACLLDNSED